jgi:hypothetical protein
MGTLNFIDRRTSSKYQGACSKEVLIPYGPD